jgi:hypothetical protein
LPGVNGDIASNATREGCFGAHNSSGAEFNRAAIPAGNNSRNIVASTVSPARAMNVQTNQCASRCGAPLIAKRPCVVVAASIRARPATVAGPVLAPPSMRHRPLAIASPRNEPPARVRAPQAFARHPGARPGSACNQGLEAPAPGSMLALMPRLAIPAGPSVVGR